MKHPHDQTTLDWVDVEPEPNTAHWYVNRDGEWMCSIHGRITALEGCEQCRASNLSSPKENGTEVSVFWALRKNGKQASANSRSHVVNASAVETTSPESGLFDASTKLVGIKNEAGVLVFSRLHTRTETYHPKVLFGRTTIQCSSPNFGTYFGGKASKK